MNFYYLLVFYRVLIMIICGIGLSALVLICTLDFLIPDELNNLNEKATMKLFDQLQEANKHQQAIVLMEYEGGILKNTPLELEYKTKLSDSYIHVGDYSKAEKMLLDVWNHADTYLNEVKDFDGNDLFEGLNKQDFYNFMKLSLARNIYQLYEKMGDSINQINYYRIYKAYYDRGKNEFSRIATAIYNSKTWLRPLSALNMNEMIEYDSISVLYYSNREKAMKEMEAFIQKTINRTEYGPSFKMKCLNRLIKWQLTNGKLIDAYLTIDNAVRMAGNLQVLKEYSNLGELSDYCYAVHDIKVSKILYKKYKQYLNANYEKTDLEYLVNTAREFKYLKAENKWDELSSKLVTYCEGMRKQIALNIPSMSEEQREYFAQQFDYAYNYSLHILQKRPSAQLANLCFDNITFKNGLLLRSNLTLRRNIERMKDKSVQKLYKDLQDNRRELLYLDASGKKLFTHKNTIIENINNLEKQLAMKCVDFREKNRNIETNYQELRNKLGKHEALVDMVEHEGALFALVLQPGKSVSYIPLGSVTEIQSMLEKPVFEIYHNKSLTKVLWGKVGQKVSDCTTIYYVPVGLFNQIALETLYAGFIDGRNQYLCDTKNMNLLSNPLEILDNNGTKLANHTGRASLWGGIDYGNENSGLFASKRTAIKRGEVLSTLRYTQTEVDDISRTLSEHNLFNVVYSSNKATEESFKARDGKGDVILHISTHGFFNENKGAINSMQESGLFFAGANKYWSNPSYNLQPGQEDGVLRAAEISNMDLTGCSLAVLSACETGLGYSNSSEGVYGLQRAFKLAGVDYILMSLWDVDERATSILMAEFYKRLFQGDNPEKALSESKKIVRNLYPSPEDWGAFVLLH